MTQPTLGMILKGYPRISETFISNEILLLENLGFSIRIFSMRQPRESFTHTSIKQIRAQAVYLPETLLRPILPLLYYNIRQCIKSPAAYGSALKIAFKRFSRTRKSASIKHVLQAGYLVNRFLPKNPVDHFHAHFAHSPGSVAMYASLISGIPFSFTAHAKDIYTSNPLQLAEKMDRARFVATCTEYNRSYLRQLPLKHPVPVFRVYHGIDIRLFTPEQRLRHPVPPYRLLTVARITAKKGLSSVYQALKILKDQGIAFEHTLIGEGDDREQIVRQIQMLGLQSVTRLMGVQPHEAVLDAFRNTDLFVIGCEIAPNGDRDGIPNVLVESMAMNVPVVATGVSAIPELVTHEKTGLLVAPGNPDQLASAMIRLLTDTELRQRIIPAARERVVNDFDNRKLIEELADIYQSGAAKR